MSVIPLRHTSPQDHPHRDNPPRETPALLHAPSSVQTQSLAQLLLGPAHAVAGHPLPPVVDILSAALALAEGRRTKSLLPLGTIPAELVLVRREDDVLVSYYDLEGSPDVRALDRPLPLRELLIACADHADGLALVDSEPISRELMTSLASRAREVTLSPMVKACPTTQRRGGAIRAPRQGVPLAFGFEAAIEPLVDPRRQSIAHSDAHAMLFKGSLWIWVRGRRIPVLRGPIMLAVQRMVSAVGNLVDAWEQSRAANVRLRAGTFMVGVRYSPSIDSSAQVEMLFGSEEGGSITAPKLSIEEASLPILRLASDVLRILVSVDRSQSRNLRVSSLREEVRALRRRIRRPIPEKSVLCADREGLRAAAAIASTPTLERTKPRTEAPRALRFGLRWEAEVEGLDGASTFLCGDRIVVATPRQTVALDRDDGHVIWAHRQPASASFMTGRVLVRVGADGRVALCDVDDGESFAETEIEPRRGGSPMGLLAGGGAIPPVAILAEGRDQLVAVDLRNGDLRWRFSTRSEAGFSLTRVGRILLVACADGTLNAVDVAHGELLWRLSVPDARFSLPVAVSGEVVLAVSGEPGRGEGVLFGVDLFSGEKLWSRDLDGPVASAPVIGGEVAVIALTTVVGESTRQNTLAAFEPKTGALRWMVPDPGVGFGAASLALDGYLLVNAPAGRVQAIGLEDGQIRWQRSLAHPVADDVPRRLEPILRGGGLFVPSAQVHVLRPQDGTSIGDPLPCELVPDWMRVDERGWVYVAEESGHLRALAPLPQLRLIR